jgi:hypothetical protein
VVRVLLEVSQLALVDAVDQCVELDMILLEEVMLLEELERDVEQSVLCK